METKDIENVSAERLQKDELQQPLASKK